MAESVGQSENKDERDLITREDLEIAIKKEVEVKPEPHECVVCLIRSQDTYDIYCTKTIASGASLHSFLSKYTRNELGHAQQCPKYVCKSCCDLINVLEQAEVEYNKLKETFEAIISKNPLFHINLVQPIQLSSVKNELEPQTNNVLFDDYDIDSEDEPLSLTKKKRRKPGKKRKKTTPVKRKTKVKPSLDESKDMDDLHPLDQPLIKRKKHWSSKVKVFVHNLHEIKKLSSSAPLETSKTDVYKLMETSKTDAEEIMETSKIDAYELHDIKDIPLSDTEANKSVTEGDCELWECGECGACGGGGAAGEAAHAHAAHAAPAAVLADVKKEDSSDGSQNQYNGFEPKIEMEMDIEFEADGVCDDDDDSSNFVPEEENIRATRKNKILLGRPLKSKVPVQKKPRKPRESKVMHKCDECDAKYSSLARLEQHKLKHDGSKPPYICEVCGAHYKHKRACDIHIQLHKGISDWKCEECNKLFPSKGALQRHNNIHTGKLNYQCDLCGKSFIHTSSFKMHKLSHSGVKPHACDVCGLALMTRSHLKRHKRVHSGEKRHECTVCGKRFSERYNLAAHSKSHEAGAGGAGGAQAQAQAPRRHLFRCPFCPDRFERRYMLERHMSVVHGRALERPPPTPRNTMSKLLKAQAQGPRRTHDIDSKDDRSPDSRSTPVTPQKLIAQLSSQAGSAAAATSWSSAYAEFNLRAEFPH